MSLRLTGQVSVEEQGHYNQSIMIEFPSSGFNFALDSSVWGGASELSIPPTISWPLNFTPSDPCSPGMPTCLLCTCLGGSVYCDDLKLDSVPPLPKDTTHFYARYNRITKINKSDFAFMSMFLFFHIKCNCEGFLGCCGCFIQIKPFTFCLSDT